MSIPMHLFSTKGIGIANESLTCLSLSLVSLQASQHFKWVQLWGIIHTAHVNKDYYVAITGHSPSGLVGDMYVFVSQDTINWVSAPAISADEISAAADLRAPFTGDPAFEHVVSVAPIAATSASASLSVNNDIVQQLPSKQRRPTTTATAAAGGVMQLSELKRVVAVVHLVGRDAYIVPRGSYVRDATSGQMVANGSFAGMRASDVGHLSAFVHLRLRFPTTTGMGATGASDGPITTDQRVLHQHDGANPNPKLLGPDFEDAVDGILDSIEGDTPTGCWTIDVQPKSVVVSNHVWPGYHHYASAVDGTYASVYVGHGRRNADVGFTL